MMVQGPEIAVVPTNTSHTFFVFSVGYHLPFGVINYFPKAGADLNNFDKSTIFHKQVRTSPGFFEHLPLVNDAPRTRKHCGTNTPRTFLSFWPCFSGYCLPYLKHFDKSAIFQMQVQTSPRLFLASAIGK